MGGGLGGGLGGGFLGAPKRASTSSLPAWCWLLSQASHTSACTSGTGMPVRVQCAARPGRDNMSDICIQIARFCLVLIRYGSPAPGTLMPPLQIVKWRHPPPLAAPHGAANTAPESSLALQRLTGPSNKAGHHPRRTALCLPAARCCPRLSALVGQMLGSLLNLLLIGSPLALSSSSIFRGTIGSPPPHFILSPHGLPQRETKGRWRVIFCTGRFISVWHRNQRCSKWRAPRHRLHRSGHATSGCRRIRW